MSKKERKLKRVAKKIDSLLAEQRELRERLNDDELLPHDIEQQVKQAEINEADAVKALNAIKDGGVMISKYIQHKPKRSRNRTVRKHNTLHDVLNRERLEQQGKYVPTIKRESQPRQRPVPAPCNDRSNDHSTPNELILAHHARVLGLDYDKMDARERKRFEEGQKEERYRMLRREARLEFYAEQILDVVAGRKLKDHPESWIEPSDRAIVVARFPREIATDFCRKVWQELAVEPFHCGELVTDADGMITVFVKDTVGRDTLKAIDKIAKRMIRKAVKARAK